MAAKRVSFLVFVVAIWAVDFAESGSSLNAPAPAVDCSSLILNMADCLSFVSNGSSVSKPEGTCCTGLKTVLKANGSCLCEAFKSSAQLGVVLNVTKAMTLPAACKVSAPAATDCGLSETPAAAPVAAMSPSSAPSGDDAMAAPSSSTAGTNDVAAASAPAPAPGSSASSSVSVSVGFFSIGLAVVSFFSF